MIPQQHGQNREKNNEKVHVIDEKLTHASSDWQLQCAQPGSAVNAFGVRNGTELHDHAQAGHTHFSHMIVQLSIF